MALSANSRRIFEGGIEPVPNDLPLAAEHAYLGGALGDDGSGNARGLNAGDAFLGFAEEERDNSGGSAGDKKMRIRQRGIVKLDVTNVSGKGDRGTKVYASDDDTFTTSSTGNSEIGKVVRHISGTTCMVYFEADHLNRD